MSRMMLAACERSGTVRDAFLAKGWDACSCDIEPCDGFGPHYRGDIFSALDDFGDEIDLMIAFPPCTHLCVSGARWFKYKKLEQDQAMKFFMALVETDIPRIAIENPIGIMSTRYRKPDQIIQPWQFWAGEPGKGEVKATCLWLKNLPKLVPTTPNETGRIPRVWKMGPSPNRGRERSRTYQGIANAMAEQWGNL